MSLIDLRLSVPEGERLDYLLDGQFESRIAILTVVVIDGYLDGPRIVVVMPFDSSHEHNRSQSDKDAK